MTPPDGGPEQTELDLTSEKDTKSGYTFMRPVKDQEVTLNDKTRFVVLPGERGHGWRLLVQTDPA
jgi:hypothetical protein